MLLPHAIAVTAPPTDTPVSLTQAKAWLLVEHTADDAELSALLAATTDHVQREAGVYLMPQTAEVGFAGVRADHPACWPDWFVSQSLGLTAVANAAELPVWPLRSITAVQYLDASGATQTWASNKYQTWAAHRPPLLAPVPNGAWPDTQAGALKPLWVTCEVGYASAATVPAAAKHAIRLIVAHNYGGNKGDGRDPTGELGIPPAAKRFLDFLRQDFYR